MHEDLTFPSLVGQSPIWFFAVLASGTKIFAKTTDPNSVPIVTILAPQRIATENYPGVFTVFRTCNTNATLNVWYDLGGMASNGVDYALIPPRLVEIAAGAASNTIVITPLANSPSSSVAKTVTLLLTNSPLMIPVNYEIGSPSRATVYIEVGGATNLLPSVNLFEPEGGDVSYTPTNTLLAAKASDPDGFVTNVEFFAGTNDLGSGTMVVLDPPDINGITGPVLSCRAVD